jgi:hypothetical protein
MAYVMVLLGLLSLGDEWSTARNLRLAGQLRTLGYGVSVHEGNLLMPNQGARVALQVTFTLGGTWGLGEIRKSHPKAFWCVLGAVVLAKGYVIYHNWRLGNGMEWRLQTHARP